MQKKRRVGIFDIDGTLFRSSLLIELTDALVQEGVFPPRTGKLYSRAARNWLDRRGPYEDYIEAVVSTFLREVKGKKYDRLLGVAEKVAAFHGQEVYRYTRELVRKLKRENYYLLAISHSPQFLVKEFAKKLGFNKIYGHIYGVDKGKKFTGKVLYLDLELKKSVDKASLLRRAIKREGLTLQDSFGVGDTESDIGFLKQVSNPICFNPNKKLYKYAKRLGWKIVVERKDVIYHL
ncbi:MAG: hypothetical protein G01um101430_164 [Parcubacteria group bacterium Gr01-1014_30]|nr:MAG: hypothetical protein G01um101430_164 [Parcubacteria group bacterium Gr01-1014_30]